MFKVYKITNNVNGKFYIGYTKLSLQDRWRRHCSSGSRKMLIFRAIEKYGVESFSIELLAELTTKHDAVKKEIELIETLKPDYNIHFGGTGGPMYGPMNGMYGKKHTDQWKASKSKQMQGINNPMYGKRHTEEVRKRLSSLKKGSIPHNKGKPMPEYLKENMRKPKSEAHKQKLRKTYVVDGEIVYNAKLFCEERGYNYICFTQAAKRNKPYKGLCVEIME